MLVPPPPLQPASLQRPKSSTITAGSTSQGSFLCSKPAAAPSLLKLSSTAESVRADSSLCALSQSTYRRSADSRPRMRSFALGITVCTLWLASAVTCGWAQEPHAPDLTDTSLEDLMKIKVESVWGASKYLQKVTQAPASVTIVTSNDIRRYGYRTLADILRSVRGFYVTYDRNYSYLEVRGFGRTGDYNSRILLLVDGHRLNDDVYDSALIGTEFPIDVDLIDRVEIIRGPSSSLYGSNAFFGVINVVTKRGRNVNGLQAAGDLASFDSQKARVSYGSKLTDGLEMLLSTSLYGSQGQRRLFFSEFNSPATNNGIAENADDDSFRQVFASASYRQLSLHAGYGSREKGIPTASFGTVFNDSRTRTTDALGYIDLEYERTLKHDLAFIGRIYYDNYYYHGNYVYNYSTTSVPFIVINRDYARAAWGGGEASVTKTLFEKHKLTVGSEYRDNFQQNQGNYDLNPFIQYVDDRRSSKIWAGYFQDEFQIRKELILSAGVRYDHYQTFGGTTNPRLGLIYSPLEKTTLKLLYGRAFRAPNAYELYYYAPGQVGNPNLKPEIIKTGEVVLEQYMGNHFRLAGAAFENKISGLIDQVTNPNGSLQFENMRAVVARGFEMELDGRWSAGYRSQIAYTFQHTRDQQTGNPLYNSPEHLANLNLAAPVIPKKIFAGLDLSYVSTRLTLAGSRAPGYAIPNVTVFTQPFLKGIEVSASVYNLFNTKYGYPGGLEHREDIIYQDGRGFRLKVMYVFGSQANHSR
jgi:outer membrane receptor for ferrienterochelin and colicin